MNQPVSDPLEAILYQCAQAAPRPWYPGHYAEAIGVHPDTLDPFLERLLLAGLGLAVSRRVPPGDYIMGKMTDKANDPVYQIIHTTGALRGQDLLHGQWWRLISSCFVHFGIAHLGMNMYFLYVLGPISEKM